MRNATGIAARPRAGVLDITAAIGDSLYKKLGMGAPPDDVAARRDALVAKKLELGHREIERRLAREMAIAARSSRLMTTALSRGGRRLCTVELRGSGGSAEAVPASTVRRPARFATSFATSRAQAAVCGSSI